MLIELIRVAGKVVVSVEWKLQSGRSGGLENNWSMQSTSEWMQCNSRDSGGHCTGDRFKEVSPGPGTMLEKDPTGHSLSVFCFLQRKRCKSRRQKLSIQPISRRLFHRFLPEISEGDGLVSSKGEQM